MNKVFAIVALAGSAATVVAGPVLVSQPIPAGNVVDAFDDSIDAGQPEAVVRVYDNWTTPGTALTGVFNSGASEIADDLTMTGGGLLTNMGLNVANQNGASNLTGGQIAIRFYDGGGSFITGFNANLPVLALPAGGSSRIQFGPNTLNGLNIILPASCFVSLQWNTVTFAGVGGMTNVGFQTRGPNLVGSSADGMINVTSNTNINFGGNPVANTSIFIDADTAIPTPGALGLLGLGGLVATRRRR